MKISSKNREKKTKSNKGTLCYKKGYLYNINSDDTKHRIKELLQLNQDLKDKTLNYHSIFNNLDIRKKELELMEKNLEEEKHNYFERYTVFLIIILEIM